MSKLLLQKLHLRKFKGIHELELNPEGKDLEIRGANASGKSSIADSFFWILFNKDSLGSADFSIKTLTPSGEPHHGLDHEVMAELALPSEKIVELRKVYREIWTKRRGSAKKEFDGNTTDHYIDGVAVQKKEYDAAIEEIAPEETFRLLTDPMYFPERLHWTKRREILLQVCGGVSEADVIASDKSLSELEDLLGDRTLEDQRKVLAGRLKKTNETLEKLPVRVDEANRNLPELPEDTEDKIREELESLRSERREAESTRQRIETGGEIAAKNQRKSEFQVKLQDIRFDLDSQAKTATSALEEDRRKIQEQLEEARRIAKQSRTAIQDGTTEIERLDAKVKSLREQWHTINNETFSHEEPTTCAACGQDLPEDKVEEAREAARKSFNESKARRLAEVDEEGKSLKERRTTLESEQEERQSALAAAETEVDRLESELAKSEVALEKARETAPKTEEDPEYQRLSKEIESLTVEVEELQAGNAGALERQDDKLEELDGKIAETETRLSLFEQHRRGEQRIEELKQEEQRTSEEAEEILRQLHLLEEATRLKVRMMDDAVNSKFKLARFKLFEEQINGGLKDVCEVTMDGRPYSSALSTSERINVGLDIINTLSEHFDFAPPVFIDGAESVTNILPTRGQQIRLIVSAEDKELRVETMEEE